MSAPYSRCGLPSLAGDTRSIAIRCVTGRSPALSRSLSDLTDAALSEVISSATPFGSSVVTAQTALLHGASEMTVTGMPRFASAAAICAMPPRPSVSGEGGTALRMKKPVTMPTWAFGVLMMDRAAASS